jgi:NADPH:quinone reductase-like Zn-dependent oxidoreductase
MKAIVQDRYGGPDVLRIADVPERALAVDTVVVRVRAVSLNAYDWHMLRGEPYLVRVSEGLRRPKTVVRGVDVAGVVDAVGSDVTEFKRGDPVFGARGSALAELVAGRERNFIAKPADVSFEEAAGIPTGAVTALQALRDKAAIQPGERVLINGSTGSVGLFAVQIAKALGAEVTAVCRTANIDLVRSVGADEVIDSSRDDFRRVGRRFDAIIDVAGGHSLRSMRRAMTPRGRLVVVGGSTGNWIGPVVRPLSAVVLSKLGSQRFLPFLASHNKADLVTLRDLLVAGRIRTVIDRTFPFAQAADALRYIDGGHARAKVVVTVPE